MTADNSEHSVSTNLVEGTDNRGNEIYNKLVLNNVLAGRVPLFNYNENFKPEFNEKAYSGSYATSYPNSNTPAKIYKLKTAMNIPVEAITGNTTDKDGNTIHEILTLKDNEVIQFRAPSFKTILTYPAYVHYYLKLNPTDSYEAAIPVTMQTLGDFLKGGPEANSDQTKAALEYYINDTNMPTTLIKELNIDEANRQNQENFKHNFDKVVSDSKAVFIKINNRYE